jgi:Tol biopolymer transport system component
MRRRISPWKSIFGLVVTVMCLVGAAFGTFPGKNGLIAFQTQTASGSQIYTVRPNGMDIRQITFVDGDAFAAAWSPNGRKIVFEHAAPGQCSNVAMMNPDGTGLVEFPAPNVCEGDPTFTPDGKRIIFSRFDPATFDEAFWSMDLNGNDRRRIGPCCADPTVSPDGKKLSYVGFNDTPGGAALFTSNLDGTNVFQVTPFSFDVAVKQDWAPDGERLVFSIYGDVAIPGLTTNVVTVRPDGSGLYFVTQYDGSDVWATAGSYSPDGRWIVFRLTDHGSFGLYKIRPDGTHLRAILPLSSFRPAFIAWGPRRSDDDGEEEEHDAP